LVGQARPILAVKAFFLKAASADINIPKDWSVGY